MDPTTIRLMDNDRYIHGLPTITRQQQAFVHTFAHTFNTALACQSAGINKHMNAKWLKDVDIATHLDFYQMENEVHVKISRGLLTNMLFDAHRKSATATEEITAIREIGKMHGVYEPEKTVNINANYTKVEQLETLSDDELLAMSGGNELTLTPESDDNVDAHH